MRSYGGLAPCCSRPFEEFMVDVSGQSLLPMVAILLIVVPGALSKVFGGVVLAFVLGALALRWWLRSGSRATEHPADMSPIRKTRYRGAHVAS